MRWQHYKNEENVEFIKEGPIHPSKRLRRQNYKQETSNEVDTEEDDKIIINDNNNGLFVSHGLSYPSRTAHLQKTLENIKKTIDKKQLKNVFLML